MRRAVSPPAAGHWNENIRQVLHKHLLLLRGKHQISITLLRVRQRTKNLSANANVRSAHVRTFFRSLKTQRDPTKIFYRHCHLFRSFLVTPRRTWREAFPQISHRRARKLFRAVKILSSTPEKMSAPATRS